jgi:hypothetical protein
MTCIINAVSGTGITQTADGSGQVKLQANGVTTNALAWVNFNGSDGSRNASYNISSVTRSGTGNYTLNFTNTMADTNYAVAGLATSGSSPYLGVLWENVGTSTKTTSAYQVQTLYSNGSGGGTNTDFSKVFVTVFGN